MSPPQKRKTLQKATAPKQSTARHAARSYQPSRSRIELAEAVPVRKPIAPKQSTMLIRYIDENELSYFSNQDIHTIQRALNEMTACRELFDSWAAKIAESRSGRQSKQEGQIRSQIGALQDDAECALLQADHIAKAMQSFSRIMVRRLQSAADTDGILEPAPEIEQTARQIQAHSAEVSSHVGRMCEKLSELVETLDKVRQENTSLKDRIWRWLKRAFEALAGLLAVSIPINPLGGLHGVGSVISSAASVISSSMSEKVSNQDFNDILNFLRETVPREARKVDWRLQNFNACQEVIRLELEIASENQVKLQPAATRRAQDFWDIQDTTLQLIQGPRS